MSRRELAPDATIGLFGHYGNENLGDEAIIDAVISNLRRRLPAAQLLGLSISPEDTTARFGMPAYPIRRVARRAGANREAGSSDGGAAGEAAPATPAVAAPGGLKARIKSLPGGQRAVSALGKLLRLGPLVVAELRFLARCVPVLRRMDLLLVCGSNQFLDNFGGSWGFPYTLFKWSLLARLCGTRVCYLCIGAGPLTRQASFGMVRWATRVADYVSFRDQASYELLADIGFAGPPLVFPDLAFSLPERNVTGSPAGAALRVGINPMPVYDARYWFEADPGRYGAYVNELAKFAVGIAERGHHVVWWPTMPKDINVINDILATPLVQSGPPALRDSHAERPETVAELRDVIDSLDISIATRFHGVVLSLAAGKPCISLCYHRKQDDLMRDTGQGEFSVMFDSIDAADLLRRFDLLVTDRDVHAEAMRLRVRSYREALARQYKEIIGAPAKAFPDPKS